MHIAANPSYHEMKLIVILEGRKSSKGLSKPAMSVPNQITDVLEKDYAQGSINF